MNPKRLSEFVAGEIFDLTSRLRKSFLEDEDDTEIIREVSQFAQRDVNEAICFLSEKCYPMKCPFIKNNHGIASVNCKCLVPNHIFAAVIKLKYLDAYLSDFFSDKGIDKLTNSNKTQLISRISYIVCNTFSIWEIILVIFILEHYILDNELMIIKNSPSVTKKEAWIGKLRQASTALKQFFCCTNISKEPNPSEHKPFLVNNDAQNAGWMDCAGFNEIVTKLTELAALILIVSKYKLGGVDSAERPNVIGLSQLCQQFANILDFRNQIWPDILSHSGSLKSNIGVLVFFMYSFLVGCSENLETDKNINVTKSFEEIHKHFHDKSCAYFEKNLPLLKDFCKSLATGETQSGLLFSLELVQQILKH